MKYNDKTQILLSNPELFKASIEEFSTNSFAIASTNEIIKKSKINKGSFYYRFTNKEELFVALANHIIVTQIDLFNQRSISLNNLDSLSDVLFEFFYNLYLLNKFDTSFYNFIVKHLYDNDSVNLINSSCIEPIYFRFKVKINTFSTISNFQYISVLVDNLYQNFPDILLNSSNIESDLKSFVEFVLVKQEENKTNKALNLESFHPNENLIFLLTKDQNLFFNDKFHTLLSNYVSFKTVYKNLKKMSGVHILLSYNKLLANLIKNSYKDISHLSVLFNEKLEYSYNSNKEFKKILLILIYLSVKEVDIVIDQTINILSKSLQQTIFHEILPILSKTSKIVVLSESIDLDCNYKDVYLIDNLNQVQKLDFANMKSDYENKYEVSTTVQGKLTYKIFTQDELADFLQDKENLNNLQQIKLLTKIDYQTIIRNEVLQ